MKYSYKENILAGIVPVRCGGDSGTAFFVATDKLLTARHVVAQSLDSSSEIHPEIYVGEKWIAGTVIALGDKEYMMDAAVIQLATPIDNIYQFKLLKSELIIESELHIDGYPEEAGGGLELFEICVMNNRIESVVKGYDVVVKRVDDKVLSRYNGFSGSPVLTRSGYVVGIATTQLVSSLAYISVSYMCNSKKLDTLGLTIEERWYLEDMSVLGMGHSFDLTTQVLDSVRGKLHQETVPNPEIETLLDSFCDVEAEERYESLVTDFLSLLREQSDTFRDWCKGVLGLKTRRLDRHNLPRLMKALKGSDVSTCGIGETERRNLIEMYMEIADYETRLSKIKKPYLALIGEAGCGKTHILCNLAKRLIDNGNYVYLMLGSQFFGHSTLGDQWEKWTGFGISDLETLNNNLVAYNKSAVILIDALNEGAGSLFWSNHLNTLVRTIDKCKRIKLVVSMRTPFERQIFNGSDNRSWFQKKIVGFENLDKAIDLFFKENNIPDGIRYKFGKELHNPLFLTIFCEACKGMSVKELEELQQIGIYHKYITARNEKVSLRCDEDPKRNVSLKYLKRIANYSLFYDRCGFTDRQRARLIAHRLCPRYSWERSLLNAALSESLLLDTLSPGSTQDMVMFQYEKLGDFLKADELLQSSMEDEQVVQYLVDQIKLYKSGKVPPEFLNMVVALLVIWNRQTDILHFKEFKIGGSVFEVLRDWELIHEGKYANRLHNRIAMSKGNYHASDILKNPQSLDDNTFADWLIWMEKLTMANRDQQWTTGVNHMVESGYWLVDTYKPILQDAALERKYQYLMAWMLTSSHPEFRAKIIGCLCRHFVSHKDNIIEIFDRLNACNDAYVLQGAYSAFYGYALLTKDVSSLQEISKRIYEWYYDPAVESPTDLIVRQWTLKILEYEQYLRQEPSFWDKVKHLTFRTSNPLRWKLSREDVPTEYFGKSHGSKKIWLSLLGKGDFDRYIIGSNNRLCSHTYYTPIRNSKNYKGVDLTLLKKMVGRQIMQLGWNDNLGSFDNTFTSEHRIENTEERLGKKYQWLSLYAIEGMLMDHTRMSFGRWNVGDAMEPQNLATFNRPWYSENASMLDPTLYEFTGDVAQKIKGELDFPDLKALQIGKVSDNTWLTDIRNAPTLRYVYRDKKGCEWVLLVGWNVVNEHKNSSRLQSVLYYNTVFVKHGDTEKFTQWAKEQGFHGRWMPEDRGTIGYLWNEYPWSESYQLTQREVDNKIAHDCPVSETSLPYVAQHQEYDLGMESKEINLPVAYLPNEDLMSKLNLYTAERGVVRDKNNHQIVAVNAKLFDGDIEGLLIRRKELNTFLEQSALDLYYCILGEKSKPSITDAQKYNMVDYSACSMYVKHGDLMQDVQPIKIQQLFIHDE